MKNFYLLAAALFSLALFSSCSRDSQDVISSAREIVVRGEWSVAHYYNTEDRTALFNGATLSFRSDGRFLVEENGITQSGSWQLLTGADRNEIIQMNLDGGATHVQDLDAYWNVDSKDIATLSMTDGAGKSLRITRN